MDTYYRTEKPLPPMHADLYRACRAMTPQEQEAVRLVADRFFPVANDGFRHNKRCDEELRAYRKRVSNAIKNGAKGGRKPKKGEPTANPDPNPRGTHEVTQKEPTEVAIQSQALLSARALDARGGHPARLSALVPGAAARLGAETPPLAAATDEVAA